MKKLYSVQYLRAIAAMMVVYCHAIDLQMVFGTSRQQQFLYLQNFGAIGVDIFFVISGFIISYISGNDNGPKAAREFMVRRWIRVAPAYYIASIIMFGLFALSSHFVLSSPPIIKTITILPVFDYGPSLWSPILVIGWTLSFEFLFYLLNAVLIACAIVKREIYLVVTIFALFATGMLMQSDNLQFGFITNPMIVEFAFGVMIAAVYKKKVNIPPAVSIVLILLGIGMFLRLIIVGYGDISEVIFVLENKSVEQRLVLWGVPSAIISAGFIWLEKAKPEWIGRNKIFLLLGDASYSIYLAHPLCYAMLGSLLKRVHILSQIQGDVLILLFVCMATSCGVLFHLYIEKPVIKKFNSLLLKPKPRQVNELAGK